MQYYKKLNVANFELIRNELEIATVDNVKQNLRFWDVSFEWFKTNAPLTYEFINSYKRVPVRLCRFYLTPKFDKLIPHVDGLTNNRSPIGLNIPIIGYQNTTMDWYSCPDDNFTGGNYGFNRITASRIIDFSKIKKIALSNSKSIPAISNPQILAVSLARYSISPFTSNGSPYPPFEMFALKSPSGA